MHRLVGLVFVAVVLAGGIAAAHVGPRDLSGYIGTDSLMTPAGKPKQVVLPASFLVSTPTQATLLAGDAALGAGGDDTSFSFNASAAGNVYVYGVQMGTCQAHVNGYITCNSGVPEFFDNHALPDSRFSGTYVFAPFWDDLIPVAGESTILTEQVAGQFFAVQWNDFALYADPTARLTFRVVFQVQASPVHQGSVLFQYLSMKGASGGGADGSSATIGIQNSNGFSANQYSANTVGAVIATVMAPGPTPSPSPSPVPGTAVQAVLFDADADGDRLSDQIETSLGSDPALHDTDNDGQDDGVEVANGANPSASPAPAALDATDPDSDTLSGAEEAFYGTNPNSADSDGDTTFQADGTTVKTSLKDNEELYGLNAHPMTNPAQADTDRDGFDDGVEIDAPTDPLNPTIHPPFASVDISVSGGPRFRPVAALDANGKIHVVASSRNDNPTGIYYYMIDPDGKIRIPETLFKLPAGITATHTRTSAVAVYQGKVYIVYESQDDGPPALAMLRLDPSKAPQDGSAVLAPTLIETSLALPLPFVGAPHHVVIAAGATGLHVLFCGNETPGESRKTGWYYALYDLNGKLVSSARLGNGGASPGHGGYGIDRKSHAAITLDAAGTAHIVIKNRTGSDHKAGPSADYYVQIKNGTVSGPYSLGGVNEAEVGIVSSGNLIYLAGTGGGGAHSQVAQSVNLAILDPKSFGAIANPPDPWGITATLNPTSMPLPFTSVYVHTDRTKGGGIAVLPSGAVVIAFKTHSDNDICIGVFAPTGLSLGTPICMNVNASYKTNSKPEPMLLAGNRVGFVFNGSRDDSAVRYESFSLDSFNLTNVPMITNTAPMITTTPGTNAAVGAAYSYAAAATDAETPAANLLWSVPMAPPGMTISASGAVSWTPKATDAGMQPVTIQVCDAGTPQRCATQSYTLTVSAAVPPVITSVPATLAVVGQPYSYQVIATDADSTISAYNHLAPSPVPGNMALSSTGAFTWTPTETDVGNVNVQLQVTDTLMLSATQSFTLTVVAAGAQPVFTSIPATIAVEGTAYTYQAVAVDPTNAGATFTYALNSTPSGDMALDATGKLTWKPTAMEHGSVTVVIQAQEGNGAKATQTFTVQVLSNNVEAAPSSGCGCVVGGRSGSETSLASLIALVGAAWLWSRRRTRRSL